MPLSDLRSAKSLTQGLPAYARPPACPHLIRPQTHLQSLLLSLPYRRAKGRVTTERPAGQGLQEIRSNFWVLVCGQVEEQWIWSEQPRLQACHGRSPAGYVAFPTRSRWQTTARAPILDSAMFTRGKFSIKHGSNSNPIHLYSADVEKSSPRGEEHVN